MTKRYKTINNIMGWALGIIASAVYIMTAEPTASWWDCGEYIATTYKLLVGHPPGAPTFQLIGHFFTLFAGDVTKVALSVNIMSGICSGLTIMLLFWTMTMLGRKLVNKLGGMTTGREIALFGSALVGALTYTFTDTFWFSAVEGEVYAMSSFFTALVFWCILKWDYEYDHRILGVNPHRWIVLIAYLVGLSIGVHLLNLLTLPAIVLVMYFKMSKNATSMGVVLTLAIISFFAGIFFSTWMMILIWIFITAPLLYICIKKGTIRSKAEWGVFLSLVFSFVLLAAILYGIIPEIVNLAGKFDIFFVNKIGMPFNSGVIIFFLIIFALVGVGLYYGFKKDKKVLQAGIFSFIFLLIGYSTFLTLIIRSNANPTIDENNPDDAVALLAYLNREQYGSNPLIYGHSYNSRPVGTKDGNPVYVRDEKTKKYVVSDPRKNVEYIYQDNMFFPRMWSYEKRNEYISWMKNQYNSDSESDKEALRHINRNKVPTHNMNMKFLHTYQFNYMYFRYFMWNFAGRQNDIQGRGDLYNGNWVTGIPFVDNLLVGNQQDLPPSMERPGHNKYYLLPLILGIIGIIFYSRKDLSNSFIVLLLFAMTGLAIAFYLNMYPFQPRERDYAFAASFYAFSIWIGFGVFGIYSLFERIKNNRIQVGAAVLTTLLCVGLVPGIMASQNWDDHDRSHRYTALAIAKNYLDSCAPNAILFTLGDNDTFPLWYAQEVEGYRTDVRVCNLSLLSAGWYIDQMKRQVYNSDPLPITLTWDQYKDGTRDVLVLDKPGNQYYNLKDIVDYVKSPEFDNQRRIVLTNDGYRNGRPIPASFSLPVDKEKVLANGTVKPGLDSLIVDRLTWNATSTRDNAFYKAYIVMMDILANNNWERPIYYASTTGAEAYLGLEEYFQLEGLAYRLVPIKTPRRPGYENGRIDSEILYNNLMHVFSDHSRVDRVNYPDAPAKEPYPYLWGGFNDPRVYHSEDNVRLINLIRSLYRHLGQSLLDEGNPQKAEEVLDFGNELLPESIFPYKLTYQWYYSLANIYYAETYFNIPTESAQQKGLDIVNIIVRHLVEDFNWLENSNDRTVQIQMEHINDNFIILNQMMLILNEEKIKLLEPVFKQIKIERTGEVYINDLNRSLEGKIKKMEDFQSIANDLQNLSLIVSLCNVTGNEATAQKGIQVIEKYLAVVKDINPQMEQMIRSTLR